MFQISLNPQVKNSSVDLWLKIAWMSAHLIKKTYETNLWHYLNSMEFWLIWDQQGDGFYLS